MNGAGHQLFPGSALSRDEDPGIGGRHPLNQIPDSIDGRRAAHQLGLRAQLLPEGPGKISGPADFQSTLNREEDGLRGQGFFDEVEGSQAGGLNRVAQGGLSAHHHHGDSGGQIADSGKGLQARHAREHEVQEDGLGGLSLHLPIPASADSASLTV